MILQASIKQWLESFLSMQLFLPNGNYILLNEGVDCSLPLSNSNSNPKAWYVESPTIEPVRGNGWVGAVAEGGSVNFRNIAFNPHGHGTHTECLGHITQEVHSVNGVIDKLLYEAEVISIVPIERMNEDGLTDLVVTRELFQNALKTEKVEAVLVRTLPNTSDKLNKNYSDTNPVYFDADVVEVLDKLCVVHFLVDVPSVDREKDNGVLAFHHAFWKVPTHNDRKRTITELIFVPDSCEDGQYLLNLQTAPFENDATPSRPVLFKLQQNEEQTS